MTEPTIAYVRKGHVPVVILKNMGDGFYKVVNAYKRTIRRRDIYINDLEDKYRNPLRKEDLDHIPKLWENE